MAAASVASRQRRHGGNDAASAPGIVSAAEAISEQSGGKKTWYRWRGEIAFTEEIVAWRA
jgi:hypothetical protein